MNFTSFVSKHIFNPLLDLKDGSLRLKTLRCLEDTQWLTEDALKKAQWEKFKAILGYAYDNCEYYRRSFDQNGITPSDIKTEADVLRIPILTKKDIQDNSSGLISARYPVTELVSASTGGSTGKSLKIYFDAPCQEIRNAAAIRSDRWANADIGVRKAALWGNPPKADTLKKRARRKLLDRIIYLDTMEMNDKTMSAFVDEYLAFKAEIIFGHSHSIFLFASFIDKHKISGIEPKGIISTSMMLMPHERAVIEKALKCKVTNRYGCEEVGLIACECERHNGMHLNIDHLYIEFINSSNLPAAPGENGGIVITDLVNLGMPLIRYKIEDVGVPTDRKCDCGRGLPLMERVNGRTADFLIKKDSSLVAGVSLVERTLTAIKGIEQMQIVQEKIDHITVRIVTNMLYDEQSKGRLLGEFSKVFGDISVRILKVDKIPQEKSGKYRFSICRLNYNAS